MEDVAFWDMTPLAIVRIRTDILEEHNAPLFRVTRLSLP